MQLRGLLAHAPPPGASLRAPPPAPALWAKAHLSFSLLVAPREPGDPLRTVSTSATAGSTAGGAAAGDGTVGGAVGRGGGGAGAQGEELLELHAVARDRREMLDCYLGLQGLSGLPPVERLSMGGLLWQLLRQLLAARERLSRHVRPGASVLYVRATRTGLPRTVRTRGTGRLAPGPHALCVQGRACQPRAYRACRVPWNPR